MGLINHLRANWIYLTGWVLAGTVGYSVGFATGLAWFGTLIWGWIIGGAITVTLQYVFIRQRLAQSGWWIFVSIVGLITGIALSMLILIAIQGAGITVAFVAILSIGASIGLGLGLGQWIVLRRQLRQAGWWVLMSTVGYALGLLAADNTPLDFLPATLLVFGPEVGGLLGAVMADATTPIQTICYRHIPGVTRPEKHERAGAKYINAIISGNE